MFPLFHQLIWFYRKNNTGNEVRVRESKHVKIYSNEQENILVLENPTYSDEGLYVLRRIGQDNNARCQKYLEILSKRPDTFYQKIFHLLITTKSQLLMALRK